MIYDVYDLCFEICQFNEMMKTDMEMNRYGAEKYHLEISKAKADMLNNLLEDFADLTKFAENFVAESDKKGLTNY